ncbi:unnamed protein product [Effrenium voratum]|uniref:Light-harvesting protein n=1 Tax=Effrenium voratum TaxID=2562239 RepID=A0AA36IVX5_9DINO|nr:unnamed protein product [Effrenium voratum]
MLVAPSFVAPAVQAPRVLPSSQQAQSASHGSVDLSSVAVAGVAASSLVAARNARKGSKTMCHFFGGSSAPSGFDPAKEMGVQDPIGFWDPLGLSADKDEATFKRRRAVEIKHGRIAMYATMGYIVPEYFKFPGYLSPSLGLKFSDVPNGLAALSKVPVLGGAQIIAFCGLIETTGFFQASSTTDGRGPREGQFSMKDSTESAEPGNYGVGFPTFLGKVEDPEARKSKLAAELANGRLAMMAIIGMFFQDGLTGSAWGDWSLYTSSPLRAREPKVARNFFGGGSTSSASFDPATELGVQDPVGFWDPLGLSADKDEATFKRRRAVEIKHGRIAMYACMGYITPEYFKFPGFLSPSLGLKFADVPNGLAALSKVPVLGGAQIIAFCGLIETTGFFQASSTTDGRGPREGQFSMKDSTESAEPGNYGVGFPTFLGKVEDPEARKSKLAAELANGRLAMMAIIGMFFQDGLTGSAWGDWSLYTSSPLRAREPKVARNFFGGGSTSSASFDPATELGVQDPVGFWDPLGLSADKDEATFKRRRAVEIKHGRIAMYACMGYITPEYFKFPGFLSPSLGLKFADVPNGLAALSKVPVLGGAQIIAFCGLIETTGFFQASSTTDGRGPREGQFSMKDSTESAEPGNYGVGFPTFLGKVEDPEARKSKLAAELANGRLAMMAIIGMFFQDGLTGSAWGDWSLYTSSPLRAREPKVARNFFGGGSTSSASFDPATELGVQDPVGFWDPLGLSADKDEATFKRRRAVEIKHGRIAMYACMGYITPEYFKFPGFLSPSLGLKFADVPNGLAALSKVPVLGGAQIIAFCGLIETTGFFQASSTTDGRGPREGQFSMKDSTESAEPGNYGVGFPTFLGKVEDPEARKSKLAAELANGRLAMMAIIGMFFQDGLTGSAWGDWSLYTSSPLRAREPKVARNFFGGGSTSSASFDPATELGVQDPVGFWDPLGLSADKDEATFKRRRAVEIKHGRIAMYACMGYITPEYFKFPGFLSPSLGLKFADVPNGLAALSKVPVLGGAQIIAFCGLIETTGFFQASSTTDGRGPREGQFSMKDSTESAEPGNYGVGFPTFLGKVEDPEARKSKLAAELANGRLAMMAIIGMFFQDGLTGSAWGDWSLYTSSPLRAREPKVARNFFGGGSTSSASFDPATELGVQDPVGFWDPLGLSADKDEATFKRRRAVEIKHGRIAMYACMGYITPEYFKFPGFLSPSLGLKFADVPNGLAALSKVPVLGGAQIIAFCGLIETTGFFQASSTTDGRGPREGQFSMKDSTESAEPGNYGVGFPTFLGKVEDPEARKSKLAAELANGRLAMMAIIGMFFQDGLTGSAWGDWGLYTASPLR